MRSDTDTFNLMTRIYITCLLVLVITPSAFADLNETYRLSLGTNVTRFNSEIIINSNDNSVEKSLDFEDDFGLDNRINSGWISGTYRVGDNHRLRITYTPVKRSAQSVSEKDIIVDNSTIKAGAAISVESRTDVVDFSYIYSLFKEANYEIGLSAGVYWLGSDTKLLAAGSIQAEGEDAPTFRSDYTSGQKIQAPMPLIGLDFDYDISSTWRTRFALRYFNIQIGEIDGRISSLEFGAEYAFNKNWSLGSLIGSFNTNIDSNGDIFTNSLGLSYDAVQIYGVFRY